MTLALVKKYVAGESIDPVTLVMLYKSTPITQAGISRWRLWVPPDRCKLWRSSNKSNSWPGDRPSITYSPSITDSLIGARLLTPPPPPPLLRLTVKTFIGFHAVHAAYLEGAQHLAYLFVHRCPRCLSKQKGLPSYVTCVCMSSPATVGISGQDFNQYPSCMTALILLCIINELLIFFSFSRLLSPSLLLLSLYSDR